jgi:hypothetical protein
MPQRPVEERRTSERFAIAVPVIMNGEASGGTHDLSATGMLFDAPVAPRDGELVQLVLTWESPGRQLACVGKVVRSQRHAQGFNIAVRLEQPLYDDPSPSSP